MPARMVSVIGAHSATREEKATAERLGALLARSGFAIVCGGMGGVMEAACRGASAQGGTTVGILPSDDPESGNRWLSIVVPTGMGTSRNRLVALSGRVVVAVGGRYGTLSEIAYALDAGRPVCSLGGWSNIPGVVEVSGPEEALDFIRQSFDWGENA